MRRVALPILLTLAFTAASHVSSGARTWYIAPDGSGVAPTIQAGIDSATAGDTVLVGCGTYYEHDVLMKSGVCLRSFSGLSECVTIDAERQGTVMYCIGASNTTRIEGFTITGGQASCNPDWCCCGGGMVLWASSPTIANCRFVGNVCAPTGQSRWGGGMYCHQSSPVLVNCTFSANQAFRGGGISFLLSSAVLTSCTFSGNSSTSDGGGIQSRLSSLALTDCTFLANLAGQSGGGIYSGNSSITLTGCAFIENSARRGGGLSCMEFLGDATLINCIFSGNSAFPGGGIYNQGALVTLANCIVAFSSEGAAVACYEGHGDVTLSCCNLYGNAHGDWVDCIRQQAGVSGNFSLDPLFCNPAVDDYTLMLCSPCAPGNHPDGWDCGLIGALPVGCQGTAVEPTTWGRIKAMFR